MRLVVFGPTISSSWGNGHATLWRGLARSLARRGHHLAFFERDVPATISTRRSRSPGRTAARRSTTSGRAGWAAMTWVLSFTGGAALSELARAFYARRWRPPPRAWGGRAAVAFAAALAGGGRYDPEVEGIVRVAEALDGVYAAAAEAGA